jgi:hypothetical protein
LNGVKSGLNEINEWIGKMMNERIGELWDKAAEGTMDYSWESQTKFMERFAELIIQDCIYTIQMKIPRNGKTPENLRSYEHVRDIRERFGVE